MAERINAVKTSFFGKGAIRLLGPELQKMGIRRALLVTDRFLYDSGAAARVGQVLSDAGVEYAVYYNVQPNPTVQVVNDCIAAARTLQVQLLVALGGGSAIDTAKAASIVVACGGTVEQYEGENKSSKPGLPIVAVNTTAGTGSEVTASSVITDSETHFKMAVISYYLIPGYALLDPELIMTVPAKIAAACGVDAFVHAEEAYVSKMANPFTDAMAEKAMELIGGNIRQFVASRDNEEAACNMMLGSTLAGIAFAWAKLGDVHAMSHPVSGFFGVAHGVANAILLPTIVEFNALADNGRYRKIYNYITNGKKADDSFVPQMLVDELKKLNAELGIPAKLSDVGVTEDKIPAMVADTMKSGNVLVNPRQTTPKDVEALYRSLL